MNSSQFIRWSGVAAIVAGVFGITNDLVVDAPWIYYSGQLLTLIAFVGIYLFQKESAGTLGLVGFLLAAVGLLFQIFGIMSGLSSMLYALGVVVLAIASLRAGSFPRWVPWMLLAGPIFGILGFALPDFESTLFLLQLSYLG